MKKSTVRFHLLIAAILLAALCLVAAQALAGNATSVYINNYELDGTAGKVYWLNGNTAGTGSDWNAYFEKDTATLWLNGAQIDTPLVHTTTSQFTDMIYANGDIILKLKGTNEIRDTNNTATYFCGVHADGNITVASTDADGSGRLNIDVSSSAYTGIGITAGIYVSGSSLTVESGKINIKATEVSSGSYGVFCDENLTLRGGDLQIECVSQGGWAFGVSAAYTFTMSGGTINAYISDPASYSHGLSCHTALVTGGDGWFYYEGDGYSLKWANADSGTFSVTGGNLIFTRANGAAFFIESNDQTLVPAVVGSILVSEDSSGAGKTTWNTSMGLLASNNSSASLFRYVEFLGSGAGAVSAPQTGDGQTPLLWLCAGLTALSGMGALLCVRRKRRA